MSKGRKTRQRVEKKRTEALETRTGPVQGLLLIDKPAGMTSHDVVQRVRRVYGERSIGHLGTLDPFATGLLILLLGRATRLATFIDAEPKIYEAVISFGQETDTDDATGTAIRTADAPSDASIRSAIPNLSGVISQVPPAFSAKSVDGTRAYDAARRGEPLDLPAVNVTVHSWQVGYYTNGKLNAVITCSGGTYIRALARDLGRLTGSAAHLAALRRTRAGRFDVADACALETLSSEPSRVKWLRVVADD
jgi:tRNA pseudouridine55 synthase